MPDGGVPLFITTQTVLDLYFEGKDAVWFYRQKKRWRDAGHPFPERLAGAHLYSRLAIDEWMAVMAGNARASGHLLGGPVRDHAPIVPSRCHPHDDGPAARLDARAERLAAQFPNRND